MRTAEDYRAQANDCVKQAQHAKGSRHRMLLLKEAEVLLRMADEAQFLQALGIEHVGQAAAP